MLDVEAALADAEATSDVVPASCVAPIQSAAKAELYDCAIIAADAVDAGNVVIPVVRHLTARVATIDADAARYVHWGATSQDILDTGLVLQLRAAVLAAALRAPGLVATMLGAMVQEHERGLGGWQAEWDTLRDLVLVPRMAAPPERHLESLLARAPTMGNRTSFGRPMPGFHNASRRAPVLLARPPTLVIGPPGTAANLLDKRPVGRGQDHAVVPVTVGDDDVARAGEEDAGRAVQMGLVGARLAGRAQLHHRPVERGIELQDSVVQSLDHPDVPLPVDLAGMEPAPGHLHPVHVHLAARSDEISVTVEHQDRLPAAVEHVEVVVLVDRDPGDTLPIDGWCRGPSTPAAAPSAGTCRAAA